MRSLTRSDLWWNLFVCLAQDGMLQLPSSYQVRNTSHVQNKAHKEEAPQGLSVVGISESCKDLALERKSSQVVLDGNGQLRKLLRTGTLSPAEYPRRIRDVHHPLYRRRCLPIIWSQWKDGMQEGSVLGGAS